MDVISMRDFTKEDILLVLDVAEDVKKAMHNPDFNVVFKEKYGRPVEQLLEGKLVGTLFLENSTRTFFSTRTAVMRAGGQVDGFPSDASTSLAKGETWNDTSVMFQVYSFDALVIRSTTEGLSRWTKKCLERSHAHLASHHIKTNVPLNYRLPMVINGGDGKNQHPTQCFLDLFTIREIARSEGKVLEGLHVALLNDLAHGRTNASLISVAHFFDFQLHFAYPRRFGPKQHQLEDLKRRSVVFYDHGNNFKEAMMASYVAYHSRPQKERVGIGEDLISIKEVGQINKSLYDAMGDTAPYLMHPKPVDSETFEEIYHDMNYHPKNITNLQASNGLYVRIALLALGLGRIQRKVNGLGSSKVASDLELVDLPLSSGYKEFNHSKSGLIKRNGLVVDHIPAGMARRLSGILGLEKENIPKVISDFMPTSGGRQPVKDMLKIHCEFQFSPAQYEAIALLAPSATINVIQTSRVVKKLRPRLGDKVCGRVTCGNGACVTNMEKEYVTPEHTLEELNGERVLRCIYCEIPETIPQIYEENRFIYHG